MEKVLEWHTKHKVQQQQSKTKKAKKSTKRATRGRWRSF